MGMLDFIPREEFVPNNKEKKVVVRCEKCNSDFNAPIWTIKTKKRSYMS
jgi:hypothetical protein